MQDKNTEKSISSSVISALTSAHDGDMALLYLYILGTGSYNPEDAARALCRTMGEITGAEEKLRRMGLIPCSGENSGGKLRHLKVITPDIEPYASERPEYTAEDIVRRTQSDGIFAGLLDECAKITGHRLSGNDMKMLFGIYDYLALPPEVIMELLNYCGELFMEKYGTGRRPSVRSIEKEAYEWARQEIITFERAEEFIKSHRERRSRLGSVKAILGIRDRQLSSSEEKYIVSWLDMGFEDEAIAIAYDRTVTGTGSLKWPYMNTIMKNWHNANLHSAKEIEEKDLRPGQRQTAPGSGKPVEIDIDMLKDAINRI